MLSAWILVRYLTTSLKYMLIQNVRMHGIHSDLVVCTQNWFTHRRQNNGGYVLTWLEIWDFCCSTRIGSGGSCL